MICSFQFDLFSLKKQEREKEFCIDIHAFNVCNVHYGKADK